MLEDFVSRQRAGPRKAHCEGYEYSVLGSDAQRWSIMLSIVVGRRECALIPYSSVAIDEPRPTSRDSISTGGGLFL